MMKFIGLLVMASPVFLKASTIRHDLDPLVYLEKGGEFSSVGQLSGRGLSGSGVYLGGDWVLTAGHVAFLKTSGSNFELNGENYAVEESVTHPDYQFGADANDIGLVKITGLATDNTGSPIMGVADDSALFGLDVVWVGYGSGGTGLSGEQGVPGTLRGFTNIVDGYGDEVGLTSTSFISDFDSPTEDENSLVSLGSLASLTSLEGNVASGDSGGGVFLNGNLVGIISYQGAFDGSFDGSYGDLSGATRLSLYEDWITEVSGIAPIPEPASGMLLAISIVFRIRRRRKC